MTSDNLLNTLSIKVSNNEIIKLILSNKPFMVTRTSLGGEIFISALYKLNKPFNEHFLYMLSNNAGIYFKEQQDVKLYADMYCKSLNNSDLIAVFNHLSYINYQKAIIPNNKILLHNRALEPFYICESRESIPWTHFLKGKKVLIIHPFVDSFQKQINNNFNIFGNNTSKFLFHKEQEFIFYKPFMTHGGIHIHNSWKETFDIMCNDIFNLDFDIALLGCGGYGVPLCNFIRTQLNKSSIYIGGGLQLMFGIMGKRWENNDFWNKIKNEYSPNFIKPSEDEQLPNNGGNKIENNCYW